MFRRIFGDTCRALREAREMTQEDLAHFTDCAISTISRIESGTTYPQWATAEKIVQVFGEKKFFQEYTEGVGLGEMTRRERLEKQCINHLKRGQHTKLEEAMVDYKHLVRENCVRDKQCFLAMQQLWLDMTEAEQGESSEKYMKILGMDKSFEELYNRQKQDLKSDSGENYLDLTDMELSYLDQLIINNLGLSYIKEGKPHVAHRVFVSLYKSLHKRGKDNPWYYKHLSVVCNNWALAFLHIGNIEKAKECVNYAITSAIKESNCATVLEILKTKVCILEKCGEMEYAEKINRFMKMAKEMSGLEETLWCESTRNRTLKMGISVL